MNETLIDEHILLLEIDNPPANSLTRQIKDQLSSILNRVKKDKTIRAIVIFGKGKNFCCGDDLKEAKENAKRKNGLIQNLDAFNKLMIKLETIQVPTIAAINGWCIGGGLDLALCCDIRVASKSARFVTAGVNIGLTASANRLPNIVGVGRAKRMLLTGEEINIETAKEWGMVTDVYDGKKLKSSSLALARLIAQKAPLAIQATKRIVNETMGMNEEEHKRYTQKELRKLSRTKDHLEALDAFVKKRKPKFSGK